eukprot:1150917-Pelagomonas_calceolata.AAC.5
MALRAYGYKYIPAMGSPSIHGWPREIETAWLCNEQAKDSKGAAQGYCSGILTAQRLNLCCSGVHPLLSTNMPASAASQRQTIRKRKRKDSSTPTSNASQKQGWPYSIRIPLL